MSDPQTSPHDAPQEGTQDGSSDKSARHPDETQKVVIVAPHAEIRINDKKSGSDSSEEKKSGEGDDKKGQKGDKKEDGEQPKKKFHWTPLKVLAAVVVGIAVLIVAGIYIAYSMAHETTDDAYTTGFVHQISARVTGNVTQLLIQDNQFVHQGDVLLRLDPTDYQVQVDKAQANYDKAKADFDRVDALKNDVAISKEDYDQTKNNLEVAKAALEDANDQLGYCTVLAPTDGYIGNRTVDVGNRVTVGGALMAVIQDVWVIANYKETQLGKMKKYQQVKITVDAIPGQTFTGHIDSFSPGTGSTFALLPPDNATGNFTKIVQRVPVKILFEPDSIKDFRKRLVPGLSVETAVDLDAPLLPINEPVPMLGD
jgi:membrane fusion protein (multidrug efflux system)